MEVIHSFSILCGDCKFNAECKDRCIVFDQPLRVTNHHPEESVKCLPCIEENNNG